MIPLGQPAMLTTQSTHMPSQSSYQAPPTVDNDFADFKSAPVNQMPSSTKQNAGDDFADFKGVANNEVTLDSMLCVLCSLFCLSQLIIKSVTISM